MQITQKKWRRINPYVCKGCGKQRYSFKFSRAHLKELCTKCQKNLPDENQTSLFEKGEFIARQEFNPPIQLSKNKEVKIAIQSKTLKIT